MRLLLAQPRTDINQRTAHGTPLHLALEPHALPALTVLLQHDADTEAPDPQGRKPLQMARDREVKSLLERKAELIRRGPPPISRGEVYRVGGLTYRLKEKLLVCNPYRNEVVLQSAEGRTEERVRLSEVEGVEAVGRSSWLMSEAVSYWRVLLRGSRDHWLLAVRHSPIRDRWLASLREQLTYLRDAVFHLPLPAAHQVVQHLDDRANSATLHRRKLPPPLPHKLSPSIMNLPLEPQQPQPPRDVDFAESRIDLGSLIDEAHKANSAPHAFHYAEVTEAEDPPEKDLRFRKNSGRGEMVESLAEGGRVCLEDFKLLRIIGRGAFGEVYLGKHTGSGRLLAVKVLSKKMLIAKKQLRYAVSEATILRKLESPFIVTLHYAFQSPRHLYLVLDYCSMGDLSELILVRERLNETAARWVAAQLLLALEHMHSKNVLYRDMKPENILIGRDGYVRLTDFGLSRENAFSMSFCGSPAYLSPEMLEKKGVSFASDLYGLGCVLFEMLTGEPPFFDANLEQLYENIRSGRLLYPSHLSLEAKSLLSKLLEKEPLRRLGVKDTAEIRRHDFFRKMDWGLLGRKGMAAPPEMFLNDKPTDK